MNNRDLFLSMLLLMLLLGGCGSAPDIPDDQAAGQAGAPQSPAERREAQWRSIISTEQGAEESRKLKVVNAFFNRLEFVDDIDHWGREDYWATPLETIHSNGGDCEDFVIGKYFTLLRLDVPDQRLRLTYVLAESVRQPHMVLSYYQNPTAEPLVLDNLTMDILTASQRPDLKPVYGFNSGGLWVADSDKAALDDPSSRLSRWRDMLRRMSEEARD